MRHNAPARRSAIGDRRSAIVRPERPDDPLLLILNLEQLLLHTRAGQIAAARATV
ncbi:MAG TPA: hypothetical protein VIT67_01215 [Povalibacter sp.]